MVLSLRAEHVRFGYGARPPVLEDVSFELAAGDVLWLLGPNGSGKTTLLRAVLGFHRIAAGSIHVRGRDVRQMTPAETAREVAYVPQSSPAIFPFSAFDVVLMGRTPHLRFMAGPDDGDRGRTWSAMSDLGIADLADRRFDELSGGERQMVLIARALAQEAPVLVLDEPCAGLDLGNQVRILQTLADLARRGYGILVTSHLPDHAFAVGTQVALLQRGRLRGPGAPRDVVTAEALGDLYGTAIEVVSVEVKDGPVASVSVCIPLMAHREGSRR